MSKEVSKIILELKDELKAEMRLFKDSWSGLDEISLRTEMDEIKKAWTSGANVLTTRTVAFRAQPEKTKRGKKENEKLRSKVFTLEKDLTASQDDHLKSEQYTRNRNIEIKGIPQAPNENLADILNKIGEVIGEPLLPKDVDVCHRVRTKYDTKTNIVVQFQRREKRDQFLEKARKKRLKKNFLGSQCDEPIYINEHLCPAMKKLLGMAIERKREHDWKFVLVKNGNILARRTEKSQIVRISRESDANKICPMDTS